MVWLQSLFMHLDAIRQNCLEIAQKLCSRFFVSFNCCLKFLWIQYAIWKQEVHCVHWGAAAKIERKVIQTKIHSSPDTRNKAKRLQPIVRLVFFKIKLKGFLIFKGIMQRIQ